MVAAGTHVTTQNQHRHLNLSPVLAGNPILFHLPLLHSEEEKEKPESQLNAMDYKLESQHEKKDRGVLNLCSVSRLTKG